MRSARTPVPEFRPHPFLFNPHLQTIAAARLPRFFPSVNGLLKEIFVNLPDGTRVRTQARLAPNASATLVVLHGMAGCSGSSYMQALASKADLQLWNCILLDLYDCRRTQCPRIFHAGESELVAQVLESLEQRGLLGPCLLAGVSMGGNILLKLLGEWGPSLPAEVAAAAVISPLIDLSESWARLELPSNRLYKFYFLRRLKQLVEAKSERFQTRINLGSVWEARSIREFDDVFTAPLSGFQDATEYYQACSAAEGLDRICVPTLMIHSRDDPLLPWEPLAAPGVRQNDHLEVVLTSSGGHVGFIARSRGENLDRFWAENRLIDFLASRL